VNKSDQIKSYLFVQKHDVKRTSKKG